MKRRTVITAVVLLGVLSVAGTAIGVDNREEFLEIEWNNTEERSSVNVTLTVTGVGGTSGLDTNNLANWEGYLCRFNASASTGRDCWHPGTIGNQSDGEWTTGVDDETTFLFLPGDSFVDFRGCTREGSDRVDCFHESDLPDATNDTLFLHNRVEIDHGSLADNTFLDNSQVFDINAAFGSEDHSLQSLSETETNTLLFFTVFFILSIHQGWILPTLGSLSAILGQMTGVSVFADFAFGLLFLLLMFMLEWASKNFVAKW